jgi:hypothetical protein
MRRAYAVGRHSRRTRRTRLIRREQARDAVVFGTDASKCRDDTAAPSCQPNSATSRTPDAPPRLARCGPAIFVLTETSRARPAHEPDHSASFSRAMSSAGGLVGKGRRTSSRLAGDLCELRHAEAGLGDLAERVRSRRWAPQSARESTGVVGIACVVRETSRAPSRSRRSSSRTRSA